MSTRDPGETSAIMNSEASAFYVAPSFCLEPGAIPRTAVSTL